MGQARVTYMYKIYAGHGTAGLEGDQVFDTGFI